MAHIVENGLENLNEKRHIDWKKDGGKWGLTYQMKLYKWLSEGRLVEIENSQNLLKRQRLETCGKAHPQNE